MLTITENKTDLSSVYSFFSDYIWAYRKGDIDRFLSLFDKDAKENGIALSKKLKSHEIVFSSIEILRYDIEFEKIQVQDNKAFVRGIFTTSYRKRGSDELLSSSGKIRWGLVWNNDGWKIKALNTVF